MGKLQKNQEGFSVVEVSLIIIILGLIGAVGWLVYDKHHTKTANQSSSISGNNSQKPVATENKITDAEKDDFYICAKSKGTVNGDHQPFVCSLNGKTYNIPSSFSTADINYFDRAPGGLQNLLLPLAEKNFNDYKSGCVQVSSTCFYPDTTINIISSNFAEVGVNNYYAPTTHDYVLQSGKWAEIPHDDYIFYDCNNIKKYNITKSSVSDPNPPDPNGIDTSFIDQCM